MAENCPLGRRAGVLVLALLFAGCGSNQIKTAPVKGKITFRGKPVPGGTVTFIPQTSGPSATGELASDGSYSLTTYRSDDGAILGPHTVIVVAMQDMSNRLPEERTPLPPPIVPEKYTSAATTDLKAEVKDGPNTIDIELKDPRTEGKGDASRPKR